MSGKRATNLFGKLLGKVLLERKLAKENAVDELWKRNELTPNQDGYKLAETTQINRDGTEITEYRLYKLIDASVVTISSEVSVNIEKGMEAAKETRSGQTR